MSADDPQKAVALQLRKLAADPDNQTFIAKQEQCMKGLVSFLDCKNDDVVIISLQALNFLSSHPLNLEPLSSYPGLLIKLTNLTERENNNIKRFALETLSNLEGYINGTHEKKDREGATFKPKTLNEICIHVVDMGSEKDRNRVERCLLSTQGVMSVTVQRQRRQVTVYTSRDGSKMEATLIKAVEDLGLIATSVRKDAPATGNKENTPPAPGQQPGYLNKQTSTPGYQNAAGSSNTKPAAAKAAPAYQSATGAAPGYQSLAGGASAPAYQQAAGRPSGPGYMNGPPPAARGGRKDSMVRYVGFGQTSLKARFAQKERERQLRSQKQEEAKSVFGRVSSFFW